MILPRDASYDIVHYHLYNGWAFVNGTASGDLAPAEMHSFLNPYWQALVWQATQMLPGRLVAFIFGGLQGLILPALYALTRRLLGPHGQAPRAVVVWSVTLAGFLCVGQFVMAASLRNDGLCALIFLASLLALIPRHGGTPSPGMLAGASLLLGLSLGLKPTNAIYVAGFAIMALAIMPNWGLRGRAAIICAVSGLFGTLVTGGPWAWHLWSEFGNPIFPIANDVFAAPMGPDGGFRDERYLPSGILDAVVRPFLFLFDGELVHEAGFFDPRFQMAYLAAPAILAMAASKSIQVPRGLVALSLGLLALIATWTAVFSISRYAIGVWMLGPVLAAAAITTWRPRILDGARPALYVALSAGLLMVVTKPPHLRRLAWTTWTGPYVSVEVPQADKYAGAVVAFSGDFPSAFTAPAFPESAILTHAVPAPWSTPALAPYREIYIRPLLQGDRPVYGVILDTQGHFERTVRRLASVERLIVDVAACETLTTSLDSKTAVWRICPMAFAE
ncbi:MAG: hypothetical protein AAF829_09165 [Pseudomonadota bacterium]